MPKLPSVVDVISLNATLHPMTKPPKYFKHVLKRREREREEKKKDQAHISNAERIPQANVLG
jgi:hypothetical protein